MHVESQQNNIKGALLSVALITIASTERKIIDLLRCLLSRWAHVAKKGLLRMDLFLLQKHNFEIKINRLPVIYQSLSVLEGVR